MDTDSIIKPTIPSLSNPEGKETACASRAELEEMVERWLLANREAESEGNWMKHVAPMYTEEAEYSWNIGPKENFMAKGRRQIEEWALGVQMEGFEDWEYPYHDIIIDEKRGEVIGFWKQIAPVKRADGTSYEVVGIGGSWFRYGGNFQWEWQQDFFDFGNVMELFIELAAEGQLTDPVKKKIALMAKGHALAGHTAIPNTMGPFKKLKGYLAMIKIVLTGK